MNPGFASTLAILCLMSVGIAGVQRAGTLKGKIINEKGKPIAGAEVRVTNTRDRSVKEARTDEAGVYLFELPPDDYTVSFDAEGYQDGTLRQMQQVEEGKATEVKTIKLKRESRTSLIRGAVFDSNGASLAGVHLKLVRVPTDEEQKDRKRIESLTKSYITNTRGEFAFRVPAARARYDITATLSGYKPETKTVDVSAQEAVPLAFSLHPVND